MTEQEWLECDNPGTMLDFLRGKATERKWRLYAVACCRQIWEHIADGRSRSSVEIAERYADGLATSDDLTRAWGVSWEVQSVLQSSNNDLAWTAARAAAEATHQVIAPVEGNAGGAGAAAFWARHMRAPCQCTLLRCIFSNHFRTITIAPDWLTPTVTDLAQAIYDERAFDRMPVLGDALEDAGCTHADVLRHCRQPAEHVRGCWLVDALIGKE